MSSYKKRQNVGVTSLIQQEQWTFLYSKIASIEVLCSFMHSYVNISMNDDSTDSNSDQDKSSSGSFAPSPEEKLNEPSKETRNANPQGKGKPRTDGWAKKKAKAEAEKTLGKIEKVKVDGDTPLKKREEASPNIDQSIFAKTGAEASDDRDLGEIPEEEKNEEIFQGQKKLLLSVGVAVVLFGVIAVVLMQFTFSKNPIGAEEMEVRLGNSGRSKLHQI